MKAKFLLLMLLALCAVKMMKAQSCDPINVTASNPYIENFSTTKWPHPNTTNNYDLFEAYPQNCWHVPYTIEAADGTPSPRLWYNGEGTPRHISLKEGSSTTQDQYVLFPVFSNSIKDLNIQFKAKINMSSTRTLYIGYYNTETGVFTQLNEVSVNDTEYRIYGPYDLNENGNAPAEFDEKYHLAFCYPGNANGYSCDITEITVGAYLTTINSNADWEIFCNHINEGQTYLNRTVTLGSNIQISKMAGDRKSPYDSFQGTFNGQGHQLILNGGDFGTPESPAGDANIAPFRYVYGATIASLEVTGHIYTSNQKAAGFVAVAGDGDLTFTNCRSSVNIHASGEGDGTHGGFIALLQGDGVGKTMTATFTNCAFTGSITTTNNTTKVGGFVGWCEWSASDYDSGRCTLVLNNCVVAPNAPCISTDSKTFARFRDESSSTTIEGVSTIRNCYYNQTIGDAQGKQRYTITSNLGVTVALAGDAIIYNVSQITAYDSNEGLRFNDTLWTGENDNVNLLLGYYGMGSVTSYFADQGTLTATGELDGTDDPHTLVMPASDVTIGATYSGDQGVFTVCDGGTTHYCIPLDPEVPIFEQHNQMIYPASALAIMAGKQINQMTFRVDVSSASLGVDLWTVSLGVTEATTLSGFDETTLLTQVFYGYLSIGNGVMTVTFDDPFYYPGGNLLVDFYHPERDSDTQDGPLFMGVVAEDASFTNRYWVYNQPQDFLPQVTFDYRVPTSTPKPSHLTVSNITDHSATVSWMAPSYTTPIRYDYDYSPVGGGSGGGGGVGAPTSIDLSTLREYTTYNFKVRAIYENIGASDYIYTTFTTRSIPVEVGDNWEEDFEDVVTDVWEFYDGYFPEKARWARGNAVNHGGSRSIYVTNGDGTTNAYTNDHKLVVYAAKLLHFTKGKFTFSFDWKCIGEKTDYGNFYDYLQVGLVPGSVAITADSIGSDRPTGWVRLHDEEFLCGSNTWQTTPDKTITVATTGDYYLVLRWRQDNGDGGSPAAVDNIHITRMFCENDVTGLAASTFTSSSALLNWDDDEGISGWQVAYSTDPNFPEEETTMVEVTVNSYSMTNLLAGTTYYAKVRTHCSEEHGYGEWCNAIEVNTKCEYITQFPWKEGFEIYNDTVLDLAVVDFHDFCWVNEYITGHSHEVFRVNNNKIGGYYHVDNGNETHQIFMPVDRNEAKALLVLPGMTLPEGTTHNYYRFALDIWRTKDPYLNPPGDFLNEGIRVFASTDDVLDEETDRELGFIPRHIYGNSATIPQVENEGYYNYSLPIGEWGEDPCYIILVGITKGYAPIYMDNFEVSVIPNTFTNAWGNHQWSTLANWWPEALGIPNVTDNVEIEAEAIIPYDYVAKAHQITIKDGGSITMQSGAQLWHANDGVRATVQKKVSQFTDQNVGDGFVFLGSPIVGEIDPTSVTNMFPENTIVDLYRFNQSANLEWENWKKEGEHYHFDLEHGIGYLYAHNYSGGDNTLGFNGFIKQSVTPVSVDLVYEPGHELSGWNLIGNPFVCNAYIDRAYYKMNPTGSGITAVENYHENPIAPCTGIMVSAEEAGAVTFSRVAPALSNYNGNLQIALAKMNQERGGAAENAVLDNAIVSFNEGVRLEKFYFGNGAKVYIPQDGKDYAIASVGTDVARNVSTIPVNFKATENGEYTLTVNPEGIEMNYLHLIDNMTGADIDLLVQPSYTFDARITDYESRFRLVFASVSENTDGDDDAPFAFVSNGEIIVIADAGAASLQVIDVMGRMIRDCTDVARNVSTQGMTTGVYILRLINGDNIKTQKIIIE